jgi:hypothetical protein
VSREKTRRITFCVEVCAASGHETEEFGLSLGAPSPDWLKMKNPSAAAVECRGWTGTKRIGADGGRQNRIMIFGPGLMALMLSNSGQPRARRWRSRCEDAGSRGPAFPRANYGLFCARCERALIKEVGKLCWWGFGLATEQAERAVVGGRAKRLPA